MDLGQGVRRIGGVAVRCGGVERIGWLILAMILASNVSYAWDGPDALNTNAATDSGSDSYPQVTTDGSGNWVAVWWSDDDLGATIGTDYDILVACSNDNGSTWTEPAALNSNAATDSGWDLDPQVTTDGSGNWVAVWWSSDSLGGTIGTFDYDILVARSNDNGSTWTTPAALNGNATTDSGSDLRPQVTTNGSGNWVAVWYSSDSLGGTIGTDEDILVARSTDNGGTWTAPAALNSNAATDSGDDDYPQVTTDGSGNWVAVWRSDDDLGATIGTDEDILVARSTDNGGTWTAPAALNSNAATDDLIGFDWYPQVTTDGSGNWVAVWQSFDTNSGAEFDIMVARSANNGATWSASAALNTSAAFDWGADEHPQVTTDGSGNWVAVWDSTDPLWWGIGTDYDILVARSTDNGVTWSQQTALNTKAATDSGSDWFPQVTTDGSDNWVAVWESTDSLGGTIGLDGDILYSREFPPLLDEVWVDFAYVGVETGSVTLPFNTMAEALNVVDTDGTIKVKGDTAQNWTPETPRITTAMRIEAINGTVRIGVSGGSKRTTQSGSSSSSRGLMGGGAAASTGEGSLADLMGAFRAALEDIPDSDTDKGEDSAKDSTVYEPVMPVSLAGDALRMAQADSVLAIRLRSENAIDPDSIWGPIPGYGEDEANLDWMPAQDGDLRDVWILFQPHETWYLEDLITLTVGADTASGDPVEPATYEFQVESEQDYQGRTTEPSEAIWQPQYNTDFDAAGLDLGTESNDTAAVTGTDTQAASEALPEGISTPFAIGPERVYEVPQRVWLPVPDGVDPNQVRVYYYHGTGDDKGWYPAENVEGWLVPDSYVRLRTNGTTYIGFVVRHAGIVQLGIPREDNN